MLAIRTADYATYFELQRNATNLRQIAIRDVPLTQVVELFEVPQPPSSPILRRR
jgi:hypothetical protein